MKLGDLVEYIEIDMGGAVTVTGQEGLIVGGPRKQTHGLGRRWEVFWIYCNKIGWWDEHRLEVISECPDLY